MHGKTFNESNKLTVVSGGSDMGIGNYSPTQGLDQRSSHMMPVQTYGTSNNNEKSIKTSTSASLKRGIFSNLLSKLKLGSSMDS
jgi:hypothetical protein